MGVSAAAASGGTPTLLLPGIRGELSPPGSKARPPFTGFQRGVKVR